MLQLLTLACLAEVRAPTSDLPQTRPVVRSTLDIEGPVRTQAGATVFGAPDWRVVAVTNQGAIRSSPLHGMQLVSPDGSATEWMQTPDRGCQPTAEPRIVFCERSDYRDLTSGELLARHPYPVGEPPNSAVLAGGWIAHIDGSTLHVQNAFTGASDTVELEAPATRVQAVTSHKLRVVAGDHALVYTLIQGHLGGLSRLPAQMGERCTKVHTDRGAAVATSPDEALFQVGNAGRTETWPDLYRVSQIRVSGDSTQFAAVLELDHPETGYERRVAWYRVHPSHYEQISERPLDHSVWLEPTPHGVVLVDWEDGDLRIEGPHGAVAVLEDLPQSMHPQVSPDGSQWHLGAYGLTLDPQTWQVSGPRIANPGRELDEVQIQGPWRVTSDGETCALWRDDALVREHHSRDFPDLSRTRGLSSDGTRMMVGPRVLDTATGDTVFDLSDAIPDAQFEALLHPDGETVLLFWEGPDTDHLSRLQASDGAPLWSLDLPRRKSTVVTSLAVSRDAQTLALSRWQRDLSLIDLETGRLRSTHQIAGIQEIAWGAGDTLGLKTAPFSGGTGTYVLQGSKVVRLRSQTASYVAFDPQGRLVLVFPRWGDQPGSIERIDLSTGETTQMPLPLSVKGVLAQDDSVLLLARGTSSLWSVSWPQG